ncbi:hypothetical protein Trco_000713 [Trichoderma cornu-damae]|uniref:Zn(2)-C6 fungal-type domain-containing protein n=1 Tax=Trichoderma cornu-damae TaxID=654480 RepID=A0A9P8QXR1_9HYPO|nr:hypothetical protein Trco_000713 [Trichoderma cornu-damae]
MEPLGKGPKACTTCAKAKARCIPGPDKDSKCERCRRLKKECVSQRPAPPRAKKAPKRSRVAELEKRLDELSSQFVDGAVAGAATAHHRSRLSAESTSMSTSMSASSTNPLSVSGHRRQRRQTVRCDGVSNMEHLFPSPRSESDEVSGWSSETGSNDCVAAGRLWPAPAEAEALLLQYHGTHAPLAPFVVVPKHLTAAKLHRQRPFLWRVVMMVSCFFDGPRQHQMGKELLAELGRMAMLDGNKSLEALQGVLLIISWLNFCLKSSQLTNLLFLARSMSVTSSSPGIQLGAAGYGGEVKWGELEHVRAYLGTYYLNAIVFNTNKKADAFMNTSQLEAFCNLLTSPGEYPSDLYLAKLVGIQMLSQSISMAMTPFRGKLTHTAHLCRPIWLTMASTLQCHMAISEILLADISISDSHCSSIALPPNDRIRLLWSCLRSLRRFYDVHESIGCCEMNDSLVRHFLDLNASDLAYAIITGIKLLLVRLPGWDPQYIVSELGIRELLDQDMRDVGELVARRESSRWTEEDPLVRMHKLLKYGRDLIDLQLQKLRTEMGAGGGGGHSTSLSQPVLVNKGEATQGWMMMGMEDLDDDLWQSFMNDTAWSLNGEPMVMDSF